MKNIISTQISDASRTKISGFITDIETELAGKTGVLDTDERLRYGSVNEQNKLVVNKAWEYRQNQPGMSAPGVDWTEFESDYQARAFLENCINRLTAILHDLESTKIMHDYDNFQEALIDYGYSQFMDGAGEPGYAAKVAEFKQFFAKTKNTPPTGGNNP